MRTAVSRRMTGRTRPASRRYIPGLLSLEGRTVLSTFTVMNLNDAGPGSLRAAIGFANANPDADVILFKAGLQGTIALASELSLNSDLTIKGPTVQPISISGGNAVRVFNVEGHDTDVSMSDLTITNGLIAEGTLTGPWGPIAMGGGILNNQGRLSLSRISFVGNGARGDAVIGAGGGAIANVFGATLVSDHCTFVGNSVRDGFSVAGGAIENDAGAEVFLLDSSFDSNESVGPFATGGAISSNNGSILHISGCSFTANLAKATGAFAALGGAVDVENIGFFDVTPSLATIESSSFSGSHAFGGVGNDGGIGGQGAGGAVYLTGSGTEISVSGCDFVGNLASAGRGGPGGGEGALAFGGAACNVGARLSIAASNFLGNEARGGAGTAGGPAGDGGAGGAGLGGAIAATTSSDASVVETEIESCIFVGNGAFGGSGGPGGIGGLGGNGGGGAVFNLVGTMSLFGCVVNANQAVGGQGGSAGVGGNGGNGGLGAGGGVFNGFLGLGGETEIVFCTIAGNLAVGGAPGVGGGVGGDTLGGGVYNGGGGTMTIAYTQIYLNKARAGRGGKGLMGGVYNDSLLILLSTSVFANVEGYLSYR